ncbi:MAG: GTP 3',8-cyclase MoaA [Halanaerobium sp.]|nr:GTP 3',8-cyclase MoaA [Halanaerobium sp.]
MVFKDSLQRKVDYLRLSITDRCNLRCRYCMPVEGVEFKPHEEILRYEEYARIVRTGTELGITKVRITGGEPLVRSGVVDLVAMLNGIEGLEEISMTTNGILLAGYARTLKEAGLARVNISLDTLQRDKYKQITRRDKLPEVWEGIEAALAAGLRPVKINAVIIKGFNDDEILPLAELASTNPLHVRFIEYMPLGAEPEAQRDKYISGERIRKLIEEAYQLETYQVKGNGPASQHRIVGGQGSIGFINPISHGFCQACNRLRLTADGRLRPCLASNIEVNLQENGQLVDDGELQAKFRRALFLKPGQHNFADSTRNDERPEDRKMFQIGG